MKGLIVVVVVALVVWGVAVLECDTSPVAKLQKPKKPTNKKKQQQINISNAFYCNK